MAVAADGTSETVVVHVYTVSWNEQQIMPYFLRHYSEVADRIVVYDNLSTDATQDIVRRCPKAELRTFETGDQLDDVQLTRIKNTAYKESRGHADFVMVVDTDEFIHHPDLTQVLMDYKRDGITLPRTRGYDMIAWRFPTSDRQLTDLVRLGRERDHYAKRSVFDPRLDMNFSLGAHKCSPVGPVIESPASDVCLMHFHYVGLLRCLRRHRVIKSRLGEWYKSRPHVAVQYRWGGVRLGLQFVKTRLKSHDVLGSRRSFVTTLAGPAYGARDLLRRVQLR